MIQRLLSALFGRLTVVRVRMTKDGVSITTVLGRLSIQYFDDRTPNLGNSDVQNGRFFRLQEGETLTLRMYFGQNQAENAKEEVK